MINRKNHKRNRKKIRCSLCGKKAGFNQKMIFGPNGINICKECITLCSHMLNDPIIESEELTTPKKEIALMKPEEIKAALDEYVIGQDRTKRILAVAVYNHYKIRRGKAHGFNRGMEAPLFFLKKDARQNLSLNMLCDIIYL